MNKNQTTLHTLQSLEVPLHSCHTQSHTDRKLGGTTHWGWVSVCREWECVLPGFLSGKLSRCCCLHVHLGVFKQEFGGGPAVGPETRTSSSTLPARLYFLTHPLSLSLSVTVCLNSITIAGTVSLSVLSSCVYLYVSESSSPVAMQSRQRKYFYLL